MRWLTEQEQESRFPAIKRKVEQKGWRGRRYTLVNCLRQNDDGTMSLYCAELEGKYEDVVAKIQSSNSEEQIDSAKEE